MTRPTKVLLVASILCLAAGMVISSNLVDTKEFTALYVVLPVGAIFFGLFLLSKLLEKETALYNQEQERHLALANRARTGVADESAKPCCQKAPLTGEAVLS